MLSSILLLILPLCYAEYAVDLSQLGSTSAFSCLRGGGYSTVFIRGYQPAGTGSADPNAVSNINLAASVGLGLEVYMTPQPYSTKTGLQQVDETINNLINGGITVRSLWLQVTSPANWPQNPTSNVAFITSALQRMRVRGITPGIYTSSYDWQQITNAANNIGNDVMLWYWNVYGQGPNGESTPNFSDFRPFGNWNSAAVKQFGQNESICGFTANRDVYGSTANSKFPNRPSGEIMPAKPTKGEKIVVGSIGL